MVTLEPLATITGRVADADGNPVSGATVRPDLLPSGRFFSLNLPQVATDDKGRFVVPDVPDRLRLRRSRLRAASPSRNGGSRSSTRQPSSQARRPTSARSGSRKTEPTLEP